MPSRILRKKDNYAAEVGTCTRADLRRKGIGTRVCRTASELLREEGCDVAVLAAAPGTERFCGQFGFVPLGGLYTFVNARAASRIGRTRGTTACSPRSARGRCSRLS